MRTRSLALPRLSLWLGLLLASGTTRASDSDAVPAPARGAHDPALVRLEVIREPGALSCAGPAEITHAVETRLRRRVFALGEPADLTASVQASRERGHFVLVISLANRAGAHLGVRRLSTRARDCSALDDSLALVLALAADVRRDDPRLTDTDEHNAGTGTAPPAPSPPLTSPLSIPEDTPPRRASLALETRAGAALAVGLLPQLAPGIEFAARVQSSRFWAFEFGVQFWHGQRLGETRGVDFAAQSIVLGVCPFEPWAEQWRLSLCAQQALQLVHARGFGFDRDQPAARWLPAIGAAASLTRDFGHAFARLSGSLLVPFVQRRYFYADGADITLYRAPWLFGTLSASLGVRW